MNSAERFFRSPLLVEDDELLRVVGARLVDHPDLALVDVCVARGRKWLHAQAYQVGRFRHLERPAHGDDLEAVAVRAAATEHLEDGHSTLPWVDGGEQAAA